MPVIIVDCLIDIDAEEEDVQSPYKDVVIPVQLGLVYNGEGDASCKQQKQPFESFGECI